VVRDTASRAGFPVSGWARVLARSSSLVGVGPSVTGSPPCPDIPALSQRSPIARRPSRLVTPTPGPVPARPVPARPVPAGPLRLRRSAGPSGEPRHGAPAAGHARPCGTPRGSARAAPVPDRFAGPSGTPASTPSGAAWPSPPARTSSGTRRSDDGPSARICSSSGVRRSPATHRTTGGSRSSRVHLVASSYRRSGPRGGSGHRRQVDPIPAVTKARGTARPVAPSRHASHGAGEGPDGAPFPYARENCSPAEVRHFHLPFL